MQDKKIISQTIKNLSSNIKKIDTNQKVNKIIKEIDSLVNQSYLDLYKIIDPRLNSQKNDKKHHCC